MVCDPESLRVFSSPTDFKIDFKIRVKLDFELIAARTFKESDMEQVIGYMVRDYIDFDFT